LDSRRRQLRIEVLDAMSNRAATDMRVDVFTLGARARKICGGVVDAHGVVDTPVLATEPLASGEYEVHPDDAAPPGIRKLSSIVTPPRKKNQ